MEVESSAAKKQDNEFYDIDLLMNRASKFAPDDFEPSEDLRTMLTDAAKVLVIGAGGLGCEILKDLAYSGFRDITVIDLDKIDVTNLNRQFLFRSKDVGSYKSEVAAKFVTDRVPECKITPLTNPIQDYDQDFYEQFHIIIAGLDNIDARRWINAMVHQMCEFDEEGKLVEGTGRPLIDGGTEGFKGQARVILPFKSGCFDCTLGSLPPPTGYALCTIRETPRLPQHCIQYVFVIEWEKHFKQAVDKDSPEDMNWIYERALVRAKEHGIEGVTYQLTMGVVKNIIPAIASTNALISAACVNEALKLATYCSSSVDNYWMFMGQTGINSLTYVAQKEPDCLVCSRNTLEIACPGFQTLQHLIDDILKAKHHMNNPSLTNEKN